MSCCGSNDDVADSKTARRIRELKEEHGIEQCLSPTLVAVERSTSVFANIYNLSSKNEKLRNVGMGIFHCGIVIYGIEWSFGESIERATETGLFCCQPGMAGQLFRSLYLGDTTMSPAQVDTILHRLENEWKSSEYHILHHNCNHFSQAFCNLLSTNERLRLPDWCNRAARVADAVVPQKVATSIQYKVSGRSIPKAAPARKRKEARMPASIIPALWYTHPSIVQEPKYQYSSDMMLSEEEIFASTRHSGSIPLSVTESQLSSDDDLSDLHVDQGVPFSPRSSADGQQTRSVPNARFSKLNSNEGFTDIHSGSMKVRRPSDDHFPADSRGRKYLDLGFHDEVSRRNSSTGKQVGKEKKEEKGKKKKTPSKQELLFFE